jgi:hypothetical protein
LAERVGGPPLISDLRPTMDDIHKLSGVRRFYRGYYNTNIHNPNQFEFPAEFRFYKSTYHLSSYSSSFSSFYNSSFSSPYQCQICDKSDFFCLILYSFQIRYFFDSHSFKFDLAMLKLMILKPVMLKLTYSVFLYLSTLSHLVYELFDSVLVKPCVAAMYVTILPNAFCF